MWGPFRRGLTKKQVEARSQIEDGLRHGDPTPYALRRNDAGYSLPELQEVHVRHLRMFANNPDLPEGRREVILQNAAEIEKKYMR